MAAAAISKKDEPVAGAELATAWADVVGDSSADIVLPRHNGHNAGSDGIVSVWRGYQSGRSNHLAIDYDFNITICAENRCPMSEGRLMKTIGDALKLA